MKKKTIYAFILGLSMATIGILSGLKYVEKIPLEKAIPVEDVAECYVGEDGYYHITLKDVGNQLDSPENLRYEEVLKDVIKG